MKIQAFDSNSKQALKNTKVQLQVKGKDSGFLSTSTDASGYIQLDDKYNGQQIASTTGGSTPSQWITAKEGEKLYVTTSKQPAGASTSHK